MGKPNDGGAAFARSLGHMTGRFSDAQEGISARDYFAAKAMMVLLAEPDTHNAPSAAALVARGAYAMADAMLAERAK